MSSVCSESPAFDQGSDYGPALGYGATRMAEENYINTSGREIQLAEYHQQQRQLLIDQYQCQIQQLQQDLQEAQLKVQRYEQSTQLYNTQLSQAEDTEMLQPRSSENSVIPSTSTNQVQCNSTFLPEWQVVRSAKRKRRDSGGIVTPQQAPNTSEIKTSNRFEALQSIINNSDNTEKTPQANDMNEDTAPTKPPPIFIPNVVKVPSFTESLREAIGQNKFTYKMYNNEVKVNPETIESYRAVIKFLNEKKAMYHTYQLKKERAFRVVLRHVHPSVEAESIQSELEELGHKVRNIHNIRHRLTKDPTCLFYVDLEPRRNNADIYKITTLMHAQVKFEPPYKKKEIVQCYRCQQYNHSRAYCKRSPRCVKCGEAHLTEMCKKDKQTKPTCALCGKGHPANYKGCRVYKELIKRTYPTSDRQKNFEEKNTTQEQYKPAMEEFPGLNSYSECPSDPLHNTNAQIKNVRSYTQALTNQSVDIGNVLHESFSRFEKILKQQAEQISSVLNLLTILISKLN